MGCGLWNSPANSMRSVSFYSTNDECGEPRVTTVRVDGHHMICTEARDDIPRLEMGAWQEQWSFSKFRKGPYSHWIHDPNCHFRTQNFEDITQQVRCDFQVNGDWRACTIPAANMNSDILIGINEFNAVTYVKAK